MTDEQYQKLNECLNECFLRLQVLDPIFIENLEMISYAGDVIIKAIECIKNSIQDSKVMK